MGRGPSYLWKHVRSGWDKLSRLIRFAVGNATDVGYWHNWWCGDGILIVRIFQ